MRLKSSSSKSFCACPNASNAAFASACLHLSGCTSKEILRNERGIAFLSQSNGRFKNSYGFSLKQDKIRSTSASRVASETSRKNSFKSVSLSLISSIGAATASGFGTISSIAFCVVKISSTLFSDVVATSSRVVVSVGRVGSASASTSFVAFVVVAFAFVSAFRTLSGFKYTSSIFPPPVVAPSSPSLTRTRYLARAGTYSITVPTRPFSSGFALIP